MTSNMDPLVVGRVVGDVIDMFVPCINMSVRYGPKRVSNGCDIKPSIAQQPPKVKISGQPIESYTLVMTDPDAPSPSEPTMREWIHWIVVNIPGGTDASQGKEVLGYMAPCPPVGIHRYVFVLFRQEASTIAVDPPSARNNFSTREFADRHHLGLPVAAVYFNAHKEPASRRS
ncbi:flowering locus T [Cinnamomum micranthum f. kanehirae]|uniref:Flowering locus T n=1 Tax=Cinnamomum micranthum f. kanehirae TaxID=337451 RepID=A0A3S3QB24_9MAGN|nr:flowering locus T [Cinnamomum micranthum f. kanehirae]